MSTALIIICLFIPLSRGCTFSQILKPCACSIYKVYINPNAVGTLFLSFPSFCQNCLVGIYSVLLPPRARQSLLFVQYCTVLNLNDLTLLDTSQSRCSVSQMLRPCLPCRRTARSCGPRACPSSVLASFRQTFILYISILYFISFYWGHLCKFGFVLWLYMLDVYWDLQCC